MNGVLLAAISVGICIQQVAKKAYNSKGGGAFTFSAAGAAFSLIIYLLTGGGSLNFTGEIIPYALGFALTYSMALIGSFLAVKYGPLSISSLVMQYSLLIPTVYGLTVLGEPVKLTLLIGLALLGISLFLVNKKSKEQGVRLSFKWAICVLVNFVGNGGCSTIQKVQQLDFNGAYKSEFMLIAIAISVVVLFVAALFTEKDRVGYNLKTGLGWYALCGLANGGVNFGTMVLANRMSASLMFPIISAGGIIATSLVSVFFYKERLSAHQLVGLILGIVAIVAMNI